MNDSPDITLPRPLIAPLGDSAIVVRFSTVLDDVANRAALALSRRLAEEPIAGTLEVVPSLVSVLIRYDPGTIELTRLAGEVALRLASNPVADGAMHSIGVRFSGADLAEVAAALQLTVEDFIAHHNSAPLRVLATGFAPGFVYCGFHPSIMHLPRRQAVRASVPVGTVLFAAGQTAITATDVPTGWHVIGETDFRNFDPGAVPPTRIAAGDRIVFEALS